MPPPADAAQVGHIRYGPDPAATHPRPTGMAGGAAAGDHRPRRRGIGGHHDDHHHTPHMHRLRHTATCRRTPRLPHLHRIRPAVCWAGVISGVSRRAPAWAPEMSAAATQWAWQQAIRPAPKLVLLALADRANAAGECWPSTARLAKDTGLYRETIHAAIQQMEAGKIIQVSRSNGRGNIYKLLIEPGQNQSEKADLSEKADSTSLVLPPTQSAKAAYHQSAFADTNLKEEPNNKLKENLKNISGEDQDKFDEAWGHYPKRSGGNPKTKARKAWNARLQAGINPQEIIDGVIRYHAWCESTKKINTEYVKQAATFFGPDNHFHEPWTIPANQNGATSHATKHQKSTALAGQIFGAAARLHDAQRESVSRNGHPVLADDGYLLPTLD